MAIKKNTFKKEERLCSEKLLSSLFNNGSSFLFYPFRVVWLLNQDDETQKFPVQLVISVSKKRFRKSVHRNLLKRRIREAFRLHKEELLYSFLRENNIKLLLGVNYIGKEILDYHYIETKMIAMFKALAKQIPV